MRGVIGLLFILFFVGSLTAQEIGETNWVIENDFRQDEQIIANNIIWLEENPFATDSNDTKAITSYVLNWVTRTPYISVTSEEVFTSGIVNNKKYKYAGKFKVTYLFGKSVYTIQNQDEPNEVDACMRGLAGMIKVYEEILKQDPKATNRDLNYYRNLYYSNRLKGYVEEQLKISKS
jgi:hypothetical protein